MDGTDDNTAEDFGPPPFSMSRGAAGGGVTGSEGVGVSVAGGVADGAAVEVADGAAVEVAVGVAVGGVRSHVAASAA